MKWELGMKVQRVAWKSGKPLSDRVLNEVQIITRVDEDFGVFIDKDGWWSFGYMERCFKPLNKIRIGGE